MGMQENKSMSINESRHGDFASQVDITFRDCISQFFRPLEDSHNISGYWINRNGDILHECLFFGSKSVEV